MGKPDNQNQILEYLAISTTRSKFRLITYIVFLTKLQKFRLDRILSLIKLLLNLTPERNDICIKIVVVKGVDTGKN